MKFALPTLMRINNLPFRNVFKDLQELVFTEEDSVPKMKVRTKTVK
jgi:hypothetical protein